LNEIIYSPSISPEKINSPSRINTEFSPERFPVELFAEQVSKDSIGSDDEENNSDKSESNFILKNLEDLNYKHAGKLIKTLIY